jgi:hypothetical protein
VSLNVLEAFLIFENLAIVHMFDEEVDEPSQHRRSLADSLIAMLAEEVAYDDGLATGFIGLLLRGQHLVDDAGEQHRLALAGLAVDPQ